MARKKYTKEFMLETIALMKKQGHSKAEASRSLDVNANMLGLD